MTERLADIGAHIHAVRQVGAVVNAMRGLAGARAQQGRNLLPAIRAYADVSARAIAQALTLQDEDSPAPHAAAQAAPVLIVFGAQQGFAGAFADQVLDAAALMMKGRHVLMIGERSAALSRERHVEPAWDVAMPARPASIVETAAEVADALYAHLSSVGANAVDMIVPVWTAGHGVVVERRPLLPLDTRRFVAAASHEPPLTTLAAPVLLERLAEEYVFAQICEAAMEAYTAENQARVQAMAAAKTNIDGQLDALQRREHQVRQDEITDEVVELAASRRRSAQELN